ncbi:unnamed protein product [Protopolystoma xenopodis]|uniref:Uncharacterized protein n=1 Tax=Protopolystoma xenopodis TaxID=117903 RepID=A0A448XN75_9PLAT|nr:unnamed protein product [Protopolystoma xenopodis]
MAGEEQIRARQSAGLEFRASCVQMRPLQSKQSHGPNSVDGPEARNRVRMENFHNNLKFSLRWASLSIFIEAYSHTPLYMKYVSDLALIYALSGSPSYLVKFVSSLRFNSFNPSLLHLLLVQQLFSMICLAFAGTIRMHGIRLLATTSSGAVKLETREIDLDLTNRVIFHNHNQLNIMSASHSQPNQMHSSNGNTRLQQLSSSAIPNEINFRKTCHRSDTTTITSRASLNQRHNYGFLHRPTNLKLSSFLPDEQEAFRLQGLASEHSTSDCVEERPLAPQPRPLFLYATISNFIIELGHLDKVRFF